MHLSVCVSALWCSQWPGNMLLMLNGAVFLLFRVSCLSFLGMVTFPQETWLFACDSSIFGVAACLLLSGFFASLTAYQQVSAVDLICCGFCACGLVFPCFHRFPDDATLTWVSGHHSFLFGYR